MIRPELIILALSVLVRLGQSAFAQETGDRKEPAAPPPRFFDRPVDYWQRGLKYEEGKTADSATSRPSGSKSGRTAPSSDWGQVVKQPDGSMVYHDLPRPLVDVLEDPSLEKIRAYFDWKMTRAQKILRAAEAMKAYRGSGALSPEASRTDGASWPAQGATPATDPVREKSALGPPPPAKGLSRGQFTLTYFHRVGCPPCDSQDPILAAWLKDKPEGRLEVIEIGARPELWTKYNVRGTPSLVIEDHNSRRTVLLEGLSREAALDQGLEQARILPPNHVPPTEGVGK